MGRSLKDLIWWVSHFDKNDIHFESIQERIDTSCSTGKLIFHVFGAIAEFERDLIRERTMAGLQSAYARGKKGGRKMKLGPKKIAALQELYQGQKHSISGLCEIFKISRRTFYRMLAREVSV